MTLSATIPADSTERDEVPFLQMRRITKRFAGVVADDQVDFDVRRGEVHSLFGENGAGKSTLMRVLYGLYRPDEGEIYINGQCVSIASPTDAIRLGVGMIHQHFMLVNTLTVAENVALGLRSTNGPLTDLHRVASRLSELADKYGLKVDPNALVWQLSVGERQRVEILKALYRNVTLLILDEPTAVLTPQEVDDLFKVLRQMTQDGKGLVFISHKVREVLGLSNRVTVLRNGRKVGTLQAADASRDRLIEMMVGQTLPSLQPSGDEAALQAALVGDVLPLSQPVAAPPASRVDAVQGAGGPPDGAQIPAAPPQAEGPVRLTVRDLVVEGDRGTNAVCGLSLEVRSGEIVGIAGVSGNGQRELAEAIAGLRKAKAGTITVNGTEVCGGSPAAVRAAGVGFVPEERMRDGVVASFTVAENLTLVDSQSKKFSRLGFLRTQQICKTCEELVAEFDIRTPSLDTPVHNLSGGNIQKLIVAREISRDPHLLLVAQPTRGIDVSAAKYIHGRLLEQRKRGTAILVVSEDLDEVLSLADRVLVMYEGAVIGSADPRSTSREDIGLMMAGVCPETVADSGMPAEPPVTPASLP